jgi:microcystin-dependent protein
MKEKFALLQIKTIKTKPLEKEKDIKQLFISDASEKRMDTTQTQLGMLARALREFIGTVAPFMGEHVPHGWLLCDGSKVSKNDYLALFTILGVEEDCDGKFRLPDLRGKTLVGLHPCDSDFDTLWQSGGSKTHTLTIAELPAHNHGITDLGHTHTGTTASAGAHTHSYADAYFAENIGLNTPSVAGTSADMDGDNDYFFRPNPVTASAGEHTHTFTTDSRVTGITINNTGCNRPHNILQPYVVVNYIIRY